MALQNPGPNKPPKCIQLKPTEMNNIDSKGLEDFVTANTFKLFELLELTSKFLTEFDLTQWEQNDEFLKAYQCVQSFRVVNDIADCEIKLIQDFNLSVTKNKEQKQYLLQAVSEHKHKF